MRPSVHATVHRRPVGTPVPRRSTHVALARVGSLSPDRGGDPRGVPRLRPRSHRRGRGRVYRPCASFARGRSHGHDAPAVRQLVLQNRLQALQIALLRSGTTRRRVDTPEAHTVAKFGEELWDALFSGDIRARFEASRSEARRLDAGMRIKLRFEDASLAALPWEYLFDAGRGDYVTLSASTPVVRYISLPQVMEPLAVRPPLRVLGMIASPSDLDALDVDRERQRLEQALASWSDAGLIELVWMTGSTARDLQAMLRRGPWHIFHFVGHGGFDANRGEGLIVLTNEDGTSNRVSATDLGRLLGDHDPLRLAVLNACESARGDSRRRVREHRRHARAPRDAGGRRDAVRDHRRRGDRVQPVVLRGDRRRHPRRRGPGRGAQGRGDGDPRARSSGGRRSCTCAPPTACCSTSRLTPARPRWRLTAAAAALAVETPIVVADGGPGAAAGRGRSRPSAPPPADRSVAGRRRAARRRGPGRRPTDGRGRRRRSRPPPAVAATGRARHPSLRSPVPVAACTAAGGRPGAVPGWSATCDSGTAGAALRAGTRGSSSPAWRSSCSSAAVVVAALGQHRPRPRPSRPSAAVTTDGPIRPTSRDRVTPPVVVPPVGPDDRRIVFANDGSGTADLYAVDPSGSETVRLTSGAGDDRYPAWSPDGTPDRVHALRRRPGRPVGDGRRRIGPTAADRWCARSTGRRPGCPTARALVFTSNRFETDSDLATSGSSRLDGSRAGAPDRRRRTIDDGHGRRGPHSVGSPSPATVMAMARSIYVLDGVRITHHPPDIPGLDRSRAGLVARRDHARVHALERRRTRRRRHVVGPDRRPHDQPADDRRGRRRPSSDLARRPELRVPALRRRVVPHHAAASWCPDGVCRDLTAGLGGNSVEPTWR